MFGRRAMAGHSYCVRRASGTSRAIAVHNSGWRCQHLVEALGSFPFNWSYEMNGLNIVVAVLPTPDDARRALRELRSSGIGLECVTLVGKGMHVDEQVAGYFGDVGGPTYCGPSASFWQVLWSLPTGSGFVYVPGLGMIVLAGELSVSIVRQLPTSGSTLAQGILGAALQSLGMPG